MNTNGWVFKLSWNPITVLSINFSFNLLFVKVPNEIKWGGEKRLIHLQAK